MAIVTALTDMSLWSLTSPSKLVRGSLVILGGMACGLHSLLVS